MAGCGQECPPDQSRPESVGFPEVGAEIKDSQLACALGHRVNCGPATGHDVQNCEQSHQSAADIDEGLHHVSPNHGGQAAFEGVDQGQCRDDRDRSNLTSAQCNGHDNGHGIHAHAFCCCPCQQEQPGS